MTHLPKKAKRTRKGREKRPKRPSLGNVYRCSYCEEMVADVTAHIDQTPACRRKRARLA